MSFSTQQFYANGTFVVPNGITKLYVSAKRIHQNSVGAGVYFMLLRREGTLMAWGQNVQGQFGNSTTTGSSTPVNIADSTGGTYTSVTGGYKHTIGIKANGNLACWGYNSYGQIGNNTRNTETTPSAVLGAAATKTFVQISAGYTNSMALGNDGTVWCWGTNGSGECGDGTTASRSTPVQVASTIGTFIDIACRGVTNYALRNDGTLWATGANNAGQIGNNTGTATSTFTQVIGSGWMAPLTGGGIGTGGFNLGNYAMAALKYSGVGTGGTLWTWGSGYVNGGAGGRGQAIAASTPVQLTLAGSNVTMVSTFFTGGLFVKQDGTLWGWGYTGGINRRFSTPVQILGSAGTLWNQAFGSINPTPSRTAATLLATAIDGSTWTWGYNGYGLLGNGTGSIASSISTPVQVIAGSAVNSIPNQYSKTVAISVQPGASYQIVLGPNTRFGNNFLTDFGQSVTVAWAD